jgi:alkanesulfonate monooxygenase SsuD/methylene tetrahydromethanopterin reductase-like flavin-dependent oxidoreductase (luciferase family)
MLAEELATLDVVTEGRLVFGAGIGYRPEEFDYLGIPFKERAARTDEILELLVKLWTQDEVTHSGRFWQLEGVKPHLKPVQDPHPPIWVGAQSVAGARRAGRFGDAFPVTPEATYEEIEERFAAVREGFAARGKPFGPQPVRRNVLVADSRDEALVEYARVSKGKYLSYASKGMTYAGDAETLDRDFLTTVAQHAVVGTDAEVVAQLTDLCTRFPVDPLLLRPQWPSMSADETIAAIERLGREVVPAIRALPTPQPEPVPAGMA